MKRLKELREDLRLNQTQLGQLVGYSQHAVSSWEKNTREPDIKTLKELSNIFNCSIDYLLDNEKEAKLTEQIKETKLTENQQKLIELITNLKDDDIIRIIGYTEGLTEKKLSEEDKINKIINEFIGE